MAITRSQIARQLLQQGGVSMVDPRMQRSLEENIARNNAAREINQAMRKPGGLRNLYTKYGFSDPQISTQFAPSMSRNKFMELSNRENLIKEIAGRNRQQMGSSNMDLLLTNRMRSLAEEDAIRRRVLAQQMNESGRTFAEGQYANEAEAIADLGLERYNQLFSKGGEVSLDDAKENAPPGEFLAYINPKEADMLRAAGGSGIMTAMGIPSFVTFSGDVAGGRSAADTLGASAFEGTGGTGRGDSPSDGDSSPPMITADPNKFDREPAPSVAKSFFERVTSPIGDAAQNLSINYIRNELERRKNYDDTFAGKLGFKPQGGDKRTKELEDALTRAIIGENVTDVIQAGRNRGGGSDGDNDFMPTLFRQNLVPEPATTEPEKTGIEKVLADADEFRFLLPERFKLEEGGRIGYRKGGAIMKLINMGMDPSMALSLYEDWKDSGSSLSFQDYVGYGFIDDYKEGGIVPRQGYFAGSFVKAVTKPVKKVFKKTTSAVKKIGKSPLGKLALAAAAVYFAPQLAGRLPAAKNPASFLGQLQSGNRLAAFKTLLPGGVSPTGETSGITKLIQSLGGGGIDPMVGQLDPGVAKDSIASILKEGGVELAKKTTKDAAKSTLLRDLALISVPSVLAGALAKEDIEDEDLDAVIAASRKDDSGLPELLAQYDDFRFVVPKEYRQSAAEGGMMDLGGNEMDLRGGGFVPIGREEKADDVPARLSKNEFVFTADAVRAAGGGSVDKGADLMYKTMKQLENKVA